MHQCENINSTEGMKYYENYSKLFHIKFFIAELIQFYSLKKKISYMYNSITLLSGQNQQ